MWDNGHAPDAAAGPGAWAAFLVDGAAGSATAVSECDSDGVPAPIGGAAGGVAAISGSDEELPPLIVGDSADEFERSTAPDTAATWTDTLRHIRW
jgi:hypothetical protein